MSIKEKAINRAIELETMEKLPAVATAIMFGAFLFIGVAFASPMEVHNAAHDARHVFSFPCH